VTAVRGERHLAAVGTVRNLLTRFGLAPLGRLGQHFLVDRNVLARIVETVAPGPEDLILEIGAGLGTVTRELAPLVRKVIAVEVDRGLLRILTETLADLSNVQVVAGDALRLELKMLLSEQRPRIAKAVSNVPYYITTPLIFRLLDAWPFERVVVMVQEEVAQRLVACPATAQYGALTVAVAARYEVDLVARVSRNCFYPAPGVDSSLVLLCRRPAAGEPVGRAALAAVVKAAFGQRRKTLLSALAGSRLPGLDRATARRLLEHAGIDARRRGETLELTEFEALARVAEQLLGPDWPDSVTPAGFE